MSEPRWNRLARYRQPIRLSAQITLAGLAAFVVGHLLGLSQVYWAVLTAVIVMQSSIGGALKASIDRFFSTLGGAAWGVVVSIALPHVTVSETAVALAVALIPLAIVVALWPRYRVAPVTAAIVLLGTPHGGGVVANALNRVFEIALGSVVALVVALVVAPSRAHLLLYGAARDALAAMRELVELLLADLAAGSDRAVVVALHDRIRAAIERGSAIAEETARERATYIADTPDPEPLVRCLRRMSHDLASLARALPMAPPDPVLSRLARPARGLAVAFAAALSDIGEALTTAARPVPSLAPVTAALEGYEAAMQGLRRDGVSRALGDAEVEQVFAMAFALDQFVRNLEELTSRAREALSPDRPR